MRRLDQRKEPRGIILELILRLSAATSYCFAHGAKYRFDFSLSMARPHYLGATQVDNTRYAALFLKMDLQFAVTHLYIIDTVRKCLPETCLITRLCDQINIFHIAQPGIR